MKHSFRNTPLAGRQTWVNDRRVFLLFRPFLRWYFFSPQDGFSSIVNGEEAEQNIPWMARVMVLNSLSECYVSNEWIMTSWVTFPFKLGCLCVGAKLIFVAVCGGALLTRLHVLSAAHCVCHDALSVNCSTGTRGYRTFNPNESQENTYCTFRKVILFNCP